jgi:hypothetical protein
MSLMGENVLADGGHRPLPLTPHFQLKDNITHRRQSKKSLHFLSYGL